MTAPSIEAVSGLLRERADASFRADGKPHHFQYTARDAGLDRRAAAALEAQARELAEAREKERVARIEAEHMREASIANCRALNAAQARIALSNGEPHDR